MELRASDPFHNDLVGVALGNASSQGGVIMYLNNKVAIIKVICLVQRHRVAILCGVMRTSVMPAVFLTLLCLFVASGFAQESRNSLRQTMQNDQSANNKQSEQTRDGTEAFDMRVFASGLTSPHQMRWGPDGQIWLLERTAGRVDRIDPASGAKTVLFTVPDILITPNTQDGLIGMALHPELGKHTGNDFVYLAFSIKADDRSPQKSGQEIIRRYTYDAAKNTLVSPKDLITELPHSSDHQSGRIVFGPDHTLYYTIGDQGANQLATYCRPSHAQDLPTAAQVAAKDWHLLEGKILRLGPDGSIPKDNPILNGVRSYVYAYGFRNAQGLAFASDGTLYQSEQGPKTDDEMNRIRSGGNYGWPYVAGYRDDKNYVFADWSHPIGVPCSSLTYSNYEIPPQVPTQAETAWKGEFIEPLRTFDTVEKGFNFKQPRCSENEYWNTCWPTRALSGLTVYESAGIPGWNRSLLAPSLKTGAVYRVLLSADGTAAPDPTYKYFKTINRYRDVLVSADGRTIYVATDSGGPTTGVDGAMTKDLANPGSILAFTYKR
jgi:PQQ-dependent dehydrogenase (s-GDH family)